MWLAQLGTTTLYIEPGSPWENGYCESFNRKLRDQCLNGEIYGAMMMRWQSHAPPLDLLAHAASAPAKECLHKSVWAIVASTSTAESCPVSPASGVRPCD